MPKNRPNILKDALYNTAPDTGATCDYAKGVVVGIVSALMFRGQSYDTAIRIVAHNLPTNYRRLSIPESWRADVEWEEDE